MNVYRMIIKDTIEEKILALQEAKKDLAEEISLVLCMTSVSPKHRACLKHNAYVIILI